MFACPNCKKNAFTKVEKFWLGPVRSIRCGYCSAKVSVPYASLFLTSVYIGLMMIIFKSTLEPILFTALVIANCVTYLYVHYNFVPLIHKFEKEHVGFKRQRMMNRLISLVYFVLTLGLIYVIFSKI